MKKSKVYGLSTEYIFLKCPKCSAVFSRECTRSRAQVLKKLSLNKGESK